MKKILLAILTIIMIAGSVIFVRAAALTFDVRVNSSESSINFRSGPSVSSQVITEIPNGQVLTVSDLSYNSTDDLFFGRTSYNSVDGWISLRQTQFLTEVPTFYVKVTSSAGSINFRSTASTGSAVITEIPAGVSLKITSMRYSSGDDLFFGMTEYNGQQGWVSLRQTSPISPTEYNQGTSANTTEQGQSAGDAGAQSTSPSIVGNWEYNVHDESPTTFYHAGYCFYEDGTGLDTFWNQTFTYTTGTYGKGEDMVTITFDDPEYGTVNFLYEFGAAYADNPLYEHDGIWLSYLTEDEAGNLLRHTGSYGDGYGRLHFGDLSEEKKAVSNIHEDTCKSWDNKWFLSTEDNVTVTIDIADMHYNYGDGVQIIPERVNGHKVTKIADKVLRADPHTHLRIEEGIQSIGDDVFNMCAYQTVTFPASVQYIGSNIFAGCDQLHIIYAPENSYAAAYFRALGMNVVSKN